MPYMPGWVQLRPPPLVLTGRLPPGPMAPLSTKAPDSPLATKPRSSRNSRVLMVKASYSSAICTSWGVSPAMAKAPAPLWLAAVTVRSGMLLIWRFQQAVAVPST